MKNVITITDTGIDFSPPTEDAEIIQNVITICTTLKGTVPLDRDFGVDTSLIDEPDTTAGAKLAAEYMKAIREYEPRAEAVRIEFEADTGGRMIPRIILKGGD